MFPESPPEIMGKRATLEIGDETIRRLPVYEYSDGEREVEVPMNRLRSYSDSMELPEVATVVHSGYRFQAQLVEDAEEAVYVFEVDHY